jgi:catechol 2,3-dioxygenase-like lactoylglutathione lyase family enzyme
VVVNVTDLERSEQFYCEGLGMTSTGRFEGHMTFLYFGDEGQSPHQFFHDIGLYKVDQAAPADFRKYSGVSHVALLMPSADAVDSATTRLRDLGYNVLKGPAVHKEDGYRYTYVEDPDRNVLELIAPTELTDQLAGNQDGTQG